MTLRPAFVAAAAAIVGVAFGYLGNEFKRDCFNREIHMAGVSLQFFYVGALDSLATLSAAWLADLLHCKHQPKENTMKYNPGHIDLSGLPRAIDFDAQVARNREIILALPENNEEVNFLKVVEAFDKLTIIGD